MQQEFINSIEDGSWEAVMLAIRQSKQNFSDAKGAYVMDKEKFQKQLEFILEIDKEKNILRQTHLTGYTRQENDAEHAWHMAIMIYLLKEYANEEAQNLPYGKQRKLEIARALASKPAILCLDEPAAGMNPTETDELMETIKIVREKFNTAILLIEHDMKLVMGICEWIKVISFGKEIATGTPDEIKNNKEVITAYLGE